MDIQERIDGMDLPEILRDRDDINEQDIPAILLRAEQLQLASEGSESELTNVNDIGQQYIEEALEEFHKKTAEENNARMKEDDKEPTFLQRPLSKRETITAFSLIGFVLLTMLVIVMSDWTMPWHTTYSPPVVSSKDKEADEAEEADEADSFYDGAWREKMVEFERPSFTRGVPEVPEDTGFFDEEIPDEEPARAPHLLALEEALQGEWVLTESYFWDKGRYNAQQETSQYRDREYLQFSQEQYFRVMDSGLFFSSRFAASDPVSIPQDVAVLPEAEVFLLHSMDVSSSISGFKRDHDFYHAELDEDQLVLFYLGTRLAHKERPIRGYRYQRKGYIYRRR